MKYYSFWRTICYLGRTVEIITRAYLNIFHVCHVVINDKVELFSPTLPKTFSFRRSFIKCNNSLKLVCIHTRKNVDIACFNDKIVENTMCWFGFIFTKVFLKLQYPIIIDKLIWICLNCHKCILDKYNLK